MSGLPPEYLVYPHRRRGLDHDFYTHRNLAEAPRVAWPGGKPLALWVAVQAGHFPMDMGNKPFPMPGGTERPYPSYWDYTQRDYGNRIGIFRLIRALAARGVPATAFLSAVLAQRYPLLLRHIREAGWEVAAGGLDMGRPHHGGLPEAEERAMIREALDLLAGPDGARPKGWHSPGFSESMNTLPLLAEAGLSYVADWVNDDLPYPVTTKSGGLLAMPISWDMSDQRMLAQQHMATGDWVESVRRTMAVLRAEAEAAGGGRVLCLTITPWVMGQPHRIAALGALLDEILADGAVWPATGEAIAAHWQAQTG